MNLQKRIYQRIARNIHSFIKENGNAPQKNFLYGCGLYGKIIAKCLRERGVPIESFVVSDEVVIGKLKTEDLLGIPVQNISAILAQKEACNLFICAETHLFGTLYSNAKALGFKYLIDVIGE
jgi:hypothetical protein